MSEEEELVIRVLKKHVEDNDYWLADEMEIALNLIKKQQNIINDMAKHIEKGCDFDNSIKTKEQIIDHFANKYEEGKG